MGAPLSFDRFHATVMVVAVIAVCPGGVGRAGFAGTVCTTFDVRLNIPHPFFDCARTRNCRGWQLHGSPLMVAVRLKCRTELASVCHRCLYCTLCTRNHPSIAVCTGSVYEAQYEVGVRLQCEEMHISVSQYTCLATMVQRILYVVAALPLYLFVCGHVSVTLYRYYSISLPFRMRSYVPGPSSPSPSPALTPRPPTTPASTARRTRRSPSGRPHEGSWSNGSLWSKARRGRSVASWAAVV